MEIPMKNNLEESMSSLNSEFGDVIGSSCIVNGKLFVKMVSGWYSYPLNLCK